MNLRLNTNLNLFFSCLDESKSVKSLKNEIMILKNSVKAEVIWVTVRRKHLWQDYTKARQNSYHPSNLIKITFCGESAIDDGGPRREFFSGEEKSVQLVKIV